MDPLDEVVEDRSPSLVAAASLIGNVSISEGGVPALAPLLIVPVQDIVGRIARDPDGQGFRGLLQLVARWNLAELEPRVVRGFLRQIGAVWEEAVDGAPNDVPLEFVGANRGARSQISNTHTSARRVFRSEVLSLINIDITYNIPMSLKGLSSA